jgi:cell division protein FtsL
MSSNRSRKINQAFAQKPWRKQLQRVGFFLAVLVFIVLIAGVNLRVNSEAAEVGREIQKARNSIAELENQITSVKAQIALLTSASVMDQRAQELGFRRATSDEIIYLVVDGYGGRSPAKLVSGDNVGVPVSPAILPPEFTQTLFDLLLERLSIVKPVSGNQAP